MWRRKWSHARPERPAVITNLHAEQRALVLQQHRRITAESAQEIGSRKATTTNSPNVYALGLYKIYNSTIVEL